MGAIMVSPRTSEELKFLLDLFERLGISAFILSEEDEERFALHHELTEAGKAFLEERAQAALSQMALRKTWQEVKSATAMKYGWAQN